jgi:hypothetical protein
MLIIGCDYHPSVQQIAFVDSETGECEERRLLHKDGEAEQFYRDLKLRGVSVRVGIEATGTPAGSSDYWRNWVSSYGLEIRPRLKPHECGSRRPIVKMRSCC